MAVLSVCFLIKAFGLKMERAKDFFKKYFNAADAGYLNKTTSFRSYFLTFEDGARLEIMNQSDLVDNEKVLLRTGYVHIAFSVGSRASVDTLTELLRQLQQSCCLYWLGLSENP